MSDAPYRIVDANINRAREAIRVVEEYVRFEIEDPALAERTKRARHVLAEIVACVGPEKLLAARSARTDVGRDIPSPSEERKTDPRAVAVAAFKRLPEALRSIEEYARIIDPAASMRAAELRFEVYQLEQDVMLAAKNTFRRVRLYVLIGSDLCPPDDMPALVADLLDAGVDAIQLREKHLNDRATTDLARALAERCRDADKLFLVNDRPDIARYVNAHGVHVGQDDLPPAAVRTLCPNRLLGVSTHTIEQVDRAVAQRPDYIAIGPAFDTRTKPHEPTAGLTFIESAADRINAGGGTPVAIGGITLDTLDRVLACGVNTIAVVAAVLKAPDPVRAAGQFARRLGEHAPS